MTRPDPIVQREPYIVLTAPDHSMSSVVHQPTGRTVAQYREGMHNEIARADAAARNKRGGEEQ